MSIDLENGYTELLLHRGHRIEIGVYGPRQGENEDDPWNVAIECMDCHEVLIDFDHPDTEEA